MAFEITPISRWSLRPDEYYLPVPYGPDGRYNAIFYFKNQTDATLLQTLQTIFAPGGLVRIGNDYNPNSFPDVLVGNADGNILMADYDSVITLGKILAANFEIVGEDMDWVGHEMFEAFGEGWAGAPVLSHYGMTFTKMSKKETLLQIIDLAKLGWKIRWRTMNDFNHIAQLVLQDGFVHSNQHYRQITVNQAVHGADIVRDVKMMEIRTDMFDDLLQNDNGLIGNNTEYVQLFENFYIIKHSVAASMREIAFSASVAPSISNLFKWFLEYIDRFCYWLDGCCHWLHAHPNVNTTMTRGFLKAPRDAFKIFIDYLETMHSNYLQGDGFLRRLDHRNLSFCVDSVTAHVRSCKANNLIAGRSQTSFTKAYGDVTIFPGLNLSSRPPRVTREALDPNEPPLQAPAQGEPGGPAGPAGPNELGERFGLGGPGGPGGPAGPNREDGGSFPPNWFGFRNSYKDPGPGPGPNTGGGRGGGPPSASTTGGRGIGGGGPPSASTTGGRGRGGGGPPSASTTGGIGRRRGRGGGAPSALTGPANLQGNQPPANRGPPPNQGFTNNQQSQPGAHGNQGLVASSMQQTSSDSFSIDQDEGSYRGKAIHQCRVHKTAYVRKGDDVFRIQRIGDFRDENAAAFVKRAIQQEANMREDYIKAIQNWEDIDVHQRSDPFHDDDDDDDRHEADPMEIDSPDERRRQIDGFKAEIAIHSLEIHKAELVLGRGVLANFDAGLEPLSSDSKSPTLEESARIPEFSINRERDKPVAQSLRMNHLLGLEGACEIYDY